jgi:hypothetical protein
MSAAAANADQEDVMVIQSRTIVGAAGALAIVGAALWGSSMLSSPASQSGHVEVQQVIERSWAVEVKDLGAEPASPDATKTAAVTQ